MSIHEEKIEEKADILPGLVQELATRIEQLGKITMDLRMKIAEAHKAGKHILKDAEDLERHASLNPTHVEKEKWLTQARSLRHTVEAILEPLTELWYPVHPQEMEQ